MEENVRFYTCPICGNTVGLIHGNGDCLKCCGKPMQLMVANSTDAAEEKHVPVYEKEGDEIVVKVGEIAHPMEEDHFISWIALVGKNQTTRIALKPGDEPVVRMQYIPNSFIYASCNKHGLWKTEVK